MTTETKTEKEKRIGIEVTNKHNLSHDSTQFKVYTKSEPKEFDGDWSKVGYSTSPTYHPTISNALKHIAIDECKVVLDAYYEIKDFGEKFDYLVGSLHNDRLINADIWFEQFKLKENADSDYSKLEKKYKEKCTECSGLNKEIRKLKGLNDESDATADVDTSEMVADNPDMSIR